MVYSRLKSIAKRMIPERHHGAITNVRDRITRCRVESYSQQGEDIILRILFAGVQRGFYVDVGAFHPMRFSNTYYFYKRGWRGINIDTTPGALNAFHKYRPRDINLEAAIARTPREMTLFMFKEAAINTLSPGLVELHSQQPGRQVVSSKTVRTRTLCEILDKYLPGGQEIDFLSVDVEGCDLEVLQSNRWNEHLPKVVLCEDLTLKNVEEVGKSDVYKFLRNKGYELFSKCFHTLIFAHSSFPTGG